MNLAQARELLDETFVRLTTEEHPGLDLVASEAAFSEVLGHLYAAQEAQESAAARRSVNEAVAGIDTAMAILQRIGGKNGVAEPLSVLGELRQALATVTVGAPVPATEPRAGKPRLLRATLQEPRTLEFSRSLLRPTLPLPEVPAPPLEAEDEGVEEAETPPPLSSIAEVEALMRAAAEGGPPDEVDEEPEAPLDAEEEEEAEPVSMEAAEAEHFGPAVTEEAVLFERMRSCMEDLATLSSMRTPAEDQTWTGREVPEQRLLTRVDALVAVGEGFFPRMVKLLERPLPDPGLWWANLFFFGSLTGQDALDQVMRLARVAPLGMPEVREAVADALALTPHPGVTEALRPWLKAPQAERRWVAATVLDRRAAVTGEALVGLARDADEAVVEAAARAMAQAGGALQPAVLRMLLYRPEEAIVRAALRTAFRWRARQGLTRARALCDEGKPDFAGAACLLAVGSEGGDGDRLREGAAKKSREAVKALGWLGELKSVETLLVALQDDALAADAVAALQRLTGASLVEDGPPPEKDLDPAPFTPTYVAPPVDGFLTSDPEVWSAWWKLHGGRAKSGVRYREGHPWHPQDDFRVMEKRESSWEERALAHLELLVRTGESLPLDQAAFVAHQRRQLEGWRSWLAAKTGFAGRGAWPTRWEG